METSVCKGGGPRRYMSPTWLLTFLMFTSSALGQDSASLLSDLLGSLTNTAKAVGCPGECVHAITAIFCDQVLEQVECGASFQRCCVPRDFSLGTPVETSPPLFDEEAIVTEGYGQETTTTSEPELPNTEPSVPLPVVPILTVATTASPANMTYHSSSTLRPFLVTARPLSSLLVRDVIRTPKPDTRPPLSLRPSLPTTTIPTPSSNTITTAMSPTSAPSLRPLSTQASAPEDNKRRDCPGVCLAAPYSFFCGTVLLEADCPDSETCCLTDDEETGSLPAIPAQSTTLSISPPVPDLASNKNNSKEGDKFLTPAPPAPCPGSCVTTLFSFLCDEISVEHHCPAEGHCCLTKPDVLETTTEPPVGQCPGSCIPTFLSGMCNRPSELILKTVDCSSGTICCFTPREDHATASNTDSSDDHDDEYGSDSRPPRLPSSTLLRPPHPPLPPRPAIQYPPMHPPHNAMIPHPRPPPPDHPLHSPHRPPPPHPHYPLLIGSPSRPRPSRPSSGISAVPHLGPFASHPYVVPVSSLHPVAIPPSQPQSPPHSLNPSALSSPQPKPHFESSNPPVIPSEPLRPQLASTPQSKPATPPAKDHKPSTTSSISLSPPTAPPGLSLPQTYDEDDISFSFSSQSFCPGACISPFLKFTCFGSSAIHLEFDCIKHGHVCCLPSGDSPPEEDDFQPVDEKEHNKTVAAASSIQSSTASKRPSPYICGVKRKGSRDTPRVVGGSDSVPGEWCWQVALINSQNQYLCGGALIGAQWVLTAAHCVTNLVRNGDTVYARVGDYDLTSEYSSRIAQTQRVATTYIHHNHNSQTLDNDIALLKLQAPVDLNDAVCLVCLPARGSTRKAGNRCVVTGYGYQGEAGPISLKVREAQVPVVDEQECTVKVNAVTEKLFILPASSFCAGGEEGNDACQGDGGGPMVCEVDGYYELTGLVSWGFGCGRANVPGVYVKVSSFIGWINQIISVNNL